MVKILNPAYGTPPLKYGLGFPSSPEAVYGSAFGRDALSHLTATFLSMGRDAGRSVDGIATNTMRCSRNFIGDHVQEYNHAAVDIARRAIHDYGRKRGILVLGDMSVMGDCYSPRSEARTVDEAASYHAEQARALREAGVDVLWAETVGNLTEGQAFAQVAVEVGLPLSISVILDGDGNVLDGTPIDEFIRTVDQASPLPPLRYLSNCSWEDKIESLYHRTRETGVLGRMGGFYNNAHNGSHDEKEGLDTISRYDHPCQYLAWVQQMLREFPSLATDETWISGCCGISAHDIDYLLTHLDEVLPAPKEAVSLPG